MGLLYKKPHKTINKDKGYGERIYKTIDKDKGNGERIYKTANENKRIRQDSQKRR